jgi:E3 ubiquitin-protein ligase RAD18
MYNDKTLRSILNDLGLPTYGNRNLLSARHKEYVNLHNANIDRRQPLPQKDLLRELSRWDSTQAQIMSSSRGEKRRFDGGEWEERCKDEFAELARRARESAKRKKIVREEKEGTK